MKRLLTRRAGSFAVCLSLLMLIGSMMVGCGSVKECMIDGDCKQGQTCLQGVCKDGTTPPKTCSYNGKTYKEGDSFPSSDGCNTCGCSNGNVQCTLRACAPTCKYNGKEYKEGDSFPSTDGCNTCTCTNGTAACTEKACNPVACDGRAGNTCSKTEYCENPNSCGFDDGQGTCKPRPQNCDTNVDPVCGCDSKTYNNICEAAAAGVSYQYKGKCKTTPPPTSCKTADGKEYKDGESWKHSDGCNTCICKAGKVACTDAVCPSSCGTRGGVTCASGQFCNQPTHCGANDQGGKCETIPQGCPENIDPVCGCDNKTYNNACDANAAGVSVKSKGKCGGTSVTCKYNGKEYKEGENFPSDDGCNTCGCRSDGSVVCTQRACGKACDGRAGNTCSKTEYCDNPNSCGFDDGQGTCKPRPQACPKNIDPVCGCDNKTYNNSCEAAAAGVSYQYKGQCKSSGKYCNYGGKTYKEGDTFPSTDGCNKCSCTSGQVVCTKKACAKTCGGIAGLTCSDPNTYCAYKMGTCNVADRAGTCAAKPQACPQVYDPVCGCDGKTYGNACSAASLGKSIDYTGACKSTGKSCTYNGQTYKDGASFASTDGCNKCTCTNGQVACTKKACVQSCGGIAGLKCKGTNEYCHYELKDICGYADATGVCKTKPQTCATIYKPVCGCNNKTYSNECSANAAGTSVQSTGACAP